MAEREKEALEEEEDEPVLAYMFDAASAKEVRSLEVLGRSVCYCCVAESGSETCLQSGHSVWAATRHLVAYLGTQAVENSDVFELGCGVGVVGLCCACVLRARRVICTDRDVGALELCESGIGENKLEDGIVSTARFCFGDLWDGAKYDWCVASDVVYDKNMACGLCKSAASVLKDEGTFLLAASFDLGGATFDRELRDACRHAGLSEPALVFKSDDGTQIWRSKRLAFS